MGGRGRAAKRDMGEAVQKCNCGGAACKGAKVSAGTTSWPVDKLTGGQGSKYLAQRETGDRIVGWGHWVGLTILGRPGGRAGMLDPTKRGGAARWWRLAVSGWERQRVGGGDVIASLPRRRGLKRKEPGLTAGLWCMKLSVQLRSCNRPRGRGHRRQRTCR